MRRAGCQEESKAAPIAEGGYFLKVWDFVTEVLFSDLIPLPAVNHYSFVALELPRFQ